MSGRTIYVGYQRYDYTRSLSGYDDTGSGIATLTLNHGADVFAVAVDNDGNFYIGGKWTATGTTRKYNSDGTLQWSAQHGNSVRAIAVDADGNVYTAGDRTSNLTVRKYNSAGSLQWSRDTGTTARGIAVDTDGYVYVCGSYYSSTNLRCYDSDGTQKWTKNVGSGAVCYSVACDNAGHLLVGTDYFSRSIYKLNLVPGNTAAPSDAWYAAHGTFYGVAFDQDGNCFGSGSRASSGHTTRKYNSLGALQWSADHGATTAAIATDPQGNAFVTGSLSGAYTTRKFSASDGAIVWSIAVAEATYGIAVFVPEFAPTEIPGLAIPIALGLPRGAFRLNQPIPALGLPLAFGVPAASQTPLPVDLGVLSGSYRQIYRLYLASSPIVELPIAAIQCRRRVGASTWMTVDIPSYTIPLGILCQNHIGGELVIYAGVDDGCGEQIGEFLRAVLTDVDITWSPVAGSMTLTARVDNPSYTQQTRALIGVLAIGAENGRRTATCAVDPLLRPNDAVFDGAATWVAGTIVYRIGPAAAAMTVTEAL